MLYLARRGDELFLENHVSRRALLDRPILRHTGAGTVPDGFATRGHRSCDSFWAPKFRDHVFFAFGQ